jgi:spheroidene monooxygenase
MTDIRTPPIQTVSLSLFRFDGLINRAWVMAQMGASRISFRAMPDVQFWKLCGSGTGEGFTPRPNWGVWAILAAWPDEDTARTRTRDAAVYRRWRAHAGESWTIFLTPTSARGRWAGAAPFTVSAAPADPPPHGPVAVLTRATIKPSRLLKFWGRVPDISATIGADSNVAFKIGIGEMPFLHQITFSLWPDPASMAAFARGDGPHGRAIRAVREGDWFREELYARFRILGSTGTWGGVNPLARLAFPTESSAA